MKDLDQWMEELSRRVFVQADEENMKILCQPKEIFVEDEFEEEE